MGFLSISEALEVKNRKFGEVELPELGGSVRLRQLSAATMLELGDIAKAGDAKANEKISRLIIRGGVIDEKGEPLFTKPNDLETFLKTVSGETMNLIVEGITALTPKKKTEESASGN